MANKMLKYCKNHLCGSSNYPRHTGRDSQVVILPKAPVWIFAYWEISFDNFGELSRQYNAEFDFSAFVI
jgi:hypothetical protein